MLFDYTKDLDIVGEPFSPSNEVLDLISKASLLNVRKEFTGCLPSSSLHQITNIMKHFDELDKVIELNEEEEAIISDYNEHSQIPSLKELLSRTSCATAPGTPTLSREQNVDEYGFIVDTSNPLTPLETIQSKSRIQKWEQLISQWDSYSTDKKRKVRMESINFHYLHFGLIDIHYSISNELERVFLMLYEEKFGQSLQKLKKLGKKCLDDTQ